jgi:branched-chain amino acid transport system substrate-binding protein
LGGGGLGRLLLRLGLVGGAVAATLAADTSCSLIVDTNANQCSASTVGADCGGFPGLRSCQDGVCVVASSAPTCHTNADCSSYAAASCTGGVCARSCSSSTDCGGGGTCTAGVCVSAAQQGECKVNKDCEKMGTYFICRKDTQKCVDLQSSLCTTVFGDYQNDDAFLFGSILPTTGPDESTGMPEQEAIELAIDDFTANADGLPPAAGQVARRPLAFVGCSDMSDTNTAIAAAQHLVNDVGVPAIIGAAFSGITISVATTVTIPAKVMLFSPSATSVAITDLDPSVPRLVWRTSPPDIYQAQALSLYMSQPTTGLEAQARALAPVPTAPIKVAVLHKGDAYGSGLASSLTGSPGNLQFNGAAATDPKNSAYFIDVDYGNPDDTAADPKKYAQTITQALSFQPNIVFIFGTNEGVDNIFEGIDEGWSTSAPFDPLYVFSDGGEVPDLFQYVASATSPGASTLRSRISGSVPGTNNALYQTFLTEYLGQFHDGSDPTVFGSAGAYDIVYLLGYSATSLLAPGVKGTAITGSDLASGMSYLVPGGTRAELDVGGNNINQAFQFLVAGTGVDYNGASGPLNFDLKHGEAASDVQIWCIKSTDQSEINSGLYFDAASTALKGAYTACN